MQCRYCKQPALANQRLCSQHYGEARTDFTHLQRDWIDLHFTQAASRMQADKFFDPEMVSAYVAIVLQVRDGKHLKDEDRALASDLTNVVCMQHERELHSLDITGEEVYRKLTGLDRHTQTGPPFYDLYAGLF